MIKKANIKSNQPLIFEDFPAQRKPGSGATIQKMTLRQVNRLKKDFNHKAGINKRQSARKFNISQQRVCQLLQNNGICARKKKKIPSRTKQQKTVARAKCGNLYLKNQGFTNPEKLTFHFKLFGGVDDFAGFIFWGK